MRLLSLVFLIVFKIVLSSSLANAQWGMGAYGMMSQCPYNYEVAGGAVSELDLLNEIEGDIRDKKEEQKNLKDDLRALDRSIQRNHDALYYTLDSTKGQTVINHIEDSLECREYKTFYTRKSDTKAVHQSESDKEEYDLEDEGRYTPGSHSFDGFTEDEWKSVCDRNNKGVLADAVCKNAVRGGSSRCTTAMGELRANIGQRDIKQAQLEAIEGELDSLNEQRRNVRREASKAQREAQKEALEGGCPECMIMGNQVYRPHRPGGLEILGGIASGAIGAFAGYLGLRQATRTNAQLGFPTNPSMGFGWPMGMMLGSMALYGAINGGMNGGFGCNGGMGGMFGPGGLMGYPFGMYPGFPGGGMYMPGGMPMMGMMGGFPMGGYPMMNMMGGMPMMNMMGGYPMMNMMGGMPMMNMMGGYPMMNMMGGYPMMNMMGGMPMMNTMGGFPMGGYPMMNMMGGMPMMPMGGMPMMNTMGGYPMSGYPMMNMMGGMPMMPMGGMPMMNMMGGMPMMGTMDGGLGSWQMQQQLMQMQMQQYQVMMEQQRRTQENMFARQRVVSGLQQELYSLLYRLQQAQSGIGLGVDLSLPGGYPGGGYPGGGYPGGYPGGGYPGGYPRPGYPGGYPQPGYPQPGYPQPGYPQPGVPGGGYPGGPVVPQRGPGVPPQR